MQSTTLPVYFGEWLRRRRKELALTQAELAGRAGCSVPALRKIESGERRPSRQLAELLARSLELPTEDQNTFIKVARGQLNLESLPTRALPGHSRAPGPRGGSAAGVLRLRSNLPVQLAPLIGREAELAALGRLLADPKCRLLAIVGMGGIGKTRLALELASQHRAQFRGGVYCVPLAQVGSAEFIVPAIADAVGLTLSGALDPEEQLVTLLLVHARNPLLIVLDCLEHLLPPAGAGDRKPDPSQLLADLLRRLPNLKFLVTSRERISIQAERTFELHGLPFPENEQSADLEQYGAPLLFMEHARHVKAEFELKPRDRQSLIRLCRFVGGVPLALELAAGWVGMLSMDEIVREMQSNLDFLETSVQGIPHRRRSLKATFDHSWRLLSPTEQQGLCRLGVFRGGFGREAAERVAGTSLATLMSLYSKALLSRTGDGRYDLHEIVRHYALSHLADDPANERTLQRHCEFYLSFAREQEKALRGGTHSQAIQALLNELDNLRAAMSWGLENGQSECSLGIAVAMAQFWHTQGYWQEGLEWLQRGLEHSGVIPDAVRASALTVAGWLNCNLGEFPLAIALLEESVAHWRRAEDPASLALALHHLSNAVLHRGDAAAAMTLAEEAFSLSQQQGYQFGMYSSLLILGHAHSHQMHHEVAIELYNKGVAQARQAGDENQIAVLLTVIGDEYAVLGDYERAEDYYGLVTAISQRLGSRTSQPYVSANRGLIAIRQGDLARASDLLAEATSSLYELGDKEVVFTCLGFAALLAEKQHCLERAARLLGAIDSLLRAMGLSYELTMQEYYDECAASVRSQLGDARYISLWIKGSAMSYEQAIGFALDQSRNA